MFKSRWSTWLAALPLLLLVGCFGGNGDIDGDGGNVEILARYEKTVVTPTGGGQYSTSFETRPARHCYIELYRSGQSQPDVQTYLDGNGKLRASVPSGVRFWARVYAAYEIPTTGSTGFFMRGSVVNAPADEPFDRTEDWYLDSDTVQVDGPGSLTILARHTTNQAGAFNIADQAVTFATKVRDLEPALRLPNLHTYWQPTNSASQPRNYPQVVFTTDNQVYKTQSGRAVFTHAVNGGRFAANSDADEFDDGVLQTTFNHLLFADYSFKEDGSKVLSLLRRDNDMVAAYRDGYLGVSRFRQSESTAAFVEGFCDFLAGAVRNTPQILDTYVDNSGQARVDVFDLSRHDQVPVQERSEFTRGSVATSLWGIQNTALNGGSTALQTLWNASRSVTALPDGTGEFNFSTLGCYPSYLLGVKARAASAWPAIVSQLALENIPEPTPAYFASTALYLTQPTAFFTLDSALKTYAASAGRYFDRDQSQAYRFTVNTKMNKTFTVTPTGSQDFWIELLGPGGWWGGKTNTQPLGPRSFSVELEPGVYAVRVRAGNTTATGTYGYTLRVQ